MALHSQTRKNKQKQKSTSHGQGKGICLQIESCRINAAIIIAFFFFNKVAHNKRELLFLEIFTLQSSKSSTGIPLSLLI